MNFVSHVARAGVSAARRRLGFDARLFARNRARLEAAVARGEELVDVVPGLGLPMIIHPDMYLRRAYDNHHFEPESVAVIRDLLRPGQLAFDVGANVGFFSLLMADCVGRTGRVCAFEPGDFAFGLLQRNKALNRNEQLELIHAGLGREAGTAEFFSGAPGMEAYNSLRPVSHRSADPTKFTSTTIPLFRGDDWCQENGVTRIDLLKVDVEGGELGVLQGFRQMLADGRIRAVLIELTRPLASVFGYAPSDILRMLQAEGFRWFQLRRHGRLEPIGDDISDTTHMYVAVACDRGRA